MTDSAIAKTRWRRAGLGVGGLCGVLAACSTATNEPVQEGGAGTAPVQTAGSGTNLAGSVGVGTAGSAVGSGGAATAGSGSGTPTAGAPAAGGTPATGPIVPLCTTKVTAQTPLIADFESYDGVIAPADYRWTFGGAAENMLGVYTGTYAFGDGSATPMLQLLAGHGGNYGLTVSVTAASKWGEGFGFYVLDANYKPACINASAYKGVSMWVRGSVPTNTFSFSVSMSQGTLPSTTMPGGSCTGTDDQTCKSPTKTDLPISPTWSQVDVLWADMTGGLSGPATPLVANGDNITGFSFGANLTFMPEAEGSEVYVAVPGDISVVVDDITFIP